VRNATQNEALSTARLAASFGTLETIETNELQNDFRNAFRLPGWRIFWPLRWEDWLFLGVPPPRYRLPALLEETMPVIALSKEMGSLDKEVAEAVAKEMGLCTVHNEIIEDLTQASGLRREAVTRLVEGRGGRFERWIARAGAFNAFSRKDLFEIALKGNVVIRGWAAPYLFHPVGHIPCVRIRAPLGSRVKNLKKALNSEDEAFIQNEIKRSDRAYAATLRMSLRMNSEDPCNYDLVLNTERCSTDYCVSAIIQLAKLPAFQETSASVAVLKRMALCARLGAALNPSPQASRVFFVLEGDDAVVRLQGLVDCRDEALALEQIVAEVPGVRKIDNRVRSISGHRALRASSL